MADIFDQLAAGSQPASTPPATAAPAQTAATPPAASTATPAPSPAGDVFDQLAAGAHPLQMQLNPPAKDLGPYQGDYELGQGVIKGAKETAQGTVKAVNWLADRAQDAAYALHLKGPGYEPEWKVPFQGQDLEAKTPLEMVGKGGESVAEFVLGDEALKGLSLAEKAKHLETVAKILDKSPKIAKALELGANALRQGTVGAGQTLLHGGTPGEALGTGAFVGGTGLALEGTAQGVKALKTFITRGPEVEQMGRELVEGLTQGATPEQVARTVGKNIADAEEKMHSTFEAGFQKISAQGQSVPVPIAGSPLQQTAKDLLTDSGIPGSVAESLKGVIPDADKIEPFLKQMSESKEVFSWDQMEATRQKIGQTIRKLPWDSPIRPDLIKVRDAIDTTFEKAATDAGNSNLSDQIKSLRGQYAQTKGLLEERAIETLRDKNPNAVADVLRGKQSVHNVNTLRRLIGPENMTAVEGSILDKMIQNASKNGQLQGRQLFRAFNDLGPDAKQAIWGNRLPQIEEFMKQAGALPNVVLDKIVNHYAPYALGTAAIYTAGRGDFKSAAAITGAAGLSALLRNPIVLDATLKGIQGLQKVAPPTVGAVMQSQFEGDNSNPTSENWTRVQFADGSVHQIHPEDVAQALKQNPGAKVQE
jgi:hypothetical protein